MTDTDDTKLEETDAPEAEEPPEEANGDPFEGWPAADSAAVIFLNRLRSLMYEMFLMFSVRFLSSTVARSSSSSSGPLSWLRRPKQGSGDEVPEKNPSPSPSQGEAALPTSGRRG